MSKWRRFRRLNGTEQWLLFQGALVLLLATAALRCFGFRFARPPNSEKNEQGTEAEERYWTKLQPRLHLRGRWLAQAKHEAASGDSAGTPIVRLMPRRRVDTDDSYRLTSLDS